MPVVVLGMILGLNLGPVGCAGPEEGILGRCRGRTALLAEALESPRPPHPGEGSTLEAFPFLFRERTPGYRVLEVLWPVFESGRSSAGSSYLRFRPLLLRDRFRDRRRLVVFPFWWRIREERETGERTVDHLWPLYGVHRRPIDLAPAVTRHVLFPLFCFREGGGGRFKVRLLPVFSLSSGFLDRGVWLLPALKLGAGRGGLAGGNRFLYILDPLFAYERFSIAFDSRAEAPGDTRTEVKVLGGLLGWERSDGRTRLRLLWFRL